MMVYSVLGFAGAICSLFAFYKVSHGSWKAKSKRFQTLNALAAALLVVYGVHTHAYANILLNAVWLLVAATALLRVARR